MGVASPRFVVTSPELRGRVKSPSKALSLFTNCFILLAHQILTIETQDEPNTPYGNKAKKPKKQGLPPTCQTFERLAVQLSKDLNFSPKLDDDTQPDFSTIILNLAIKTTILHWCDSSCTQHPLPSDYTSLEHHAREQNNKEQEKENLIRVSKKELLDAVVNNPPVIFSHATTELGPRVNHFNSGA
ncbi:hypothetical protein JHK86_025422 [Glycine max]|nr:hypothetical protein JHK86_025422 [Glycine max]